MGELALAWGGPVVVALAWVLVRRRGITIWTAMGLTLAPLGVLAVLLGDVRAGGDLGAVAAGGVGVGAGLALYGATAAFMWIVRRWPPLARHAGVLYDQRRGLPLGVALGIAVVVVAPGEELLWRGVVQDALAGPLGRLAGAVTAWAVYIAANALAGSIPILLAAGVGGAAWGALAFWTEGVLAGALCHMVWTGLMIVAPPVFVPEMAR